MRFRPWNGVFLNEKYLTDVDSATEVTRELLDIYKEHGVVPLVESAVQGKDGFRTVHDLLQI